MHLALLRSAVATKKEAKKYDLIVSMDRFIEDEQADGELAGDIA